MVGRKRQPGLQGVPGELTPLDYKQLVALQRQLANQVITQDGFGSLDQLRLVAGADVGFEQQGTVTRGAVAVLTFPALELVDYAIARLPTNMPYIPGLLSFRETPVLLDALSQLGQQPEIILVDGQGQAHPRRFGIACHLGVLTGTPTIGVAKSRLCGEHVELPPEKGSWVPLFDKLADKAECIGAVLRTRDNVKPLYISSGHKRSLESAIQLVLACTTRYKLPETTRWADALASNRRQPPF